MAALGIGQSGAADRASFALANRLVGNEPTAAVLEATLGGLVLRAEADMLVSVTGARCPDAPHNAVSLLRSGRCLRLGTPGAGLRTYVGVRGGFWVPEVLGSRSTDVLAGLGPEPLTAGDVLEVGPPPPRFPNVDVAPRADPSWQTLTVGVGPGPRRDWFTDAGWRCLLEASYEVTGDSNRIGIRLEGPEVERAWSGELPSEGMARGALQVPPSGKPVLFLADHPVTGGYPVIGYVTDSEVDACAQLRPGQLVRFRDQRASRQ